ncbi:MAG: hypothetical protein ACKPKO_24920 [Candidatus Fonsibacter sp.]
MLFYSTLYHQARRWLIICALFTSYYHLLRKYDNFLHLRLNYLNEYRYIIIYIYIYE